MLFEIAIFDLVGFIATLHRKFNLNAVILVPFLIFRTALLEQQKFEQCPRCITSEDYERERSIGIVPVAVLYIHQKPIGIARYVEINRGLSAESHW